MNETSSETFLVNIVPPATAFYPLEGRKYTLAQSEITGNLFLTISNQYCYSQTNAMGVTDILKAEWMTKLGEYALIGKIFLTEFENENSRLTQVRYMILQKELPNMMNLVVRADAQFLKNYPLLLDAPIIIQFEAPNQELRGSFPLGTPRQYLLKESLKQDTVNY